MRGRRKRRGLDANGELSLSMCPSFFSFGCNPMAMSPEFQNKILHRLRNRLCPCCGKPVRFCKCKSGDRLPAGAHTIRTHNNKKLRNARAVVHQKEHYYHLFVKMKADMLAIFGEVQYATLEYAFYWHQVPKMPWGVFEAGLGLAGIDYAPFRVCWTKEE